LAREKGFLAAMRIIILAVIALLTFIASTALISAQDRAAVRASTVKVKFEKY
jgi:hypothetical protein